MTNATDDQAFIGKMQELESLLRDLEKFPDPAVRETMAQAVQTLMDYHSAGISRILHHLHTVGDAGSEVLQKLGEDELVSSLLLLYGLHPMDIDARVMSALEKVRPYLKSHGGNVRLIGIEDGVVRLEMQGSCHGCPSSAATLKNSIEEAIYEKAPDVMGIEVVDLTAPVEVAATGFVPVEQLTKNLHKGAHHEDLQVQTAGGCACGGH